MKHKLALLATAAVAGAGGALIFAGQAFAYHFH